MIELYPASPALSSLPKDGGIAEPHAGSRNIRILSFQIESLGTRYLVQTGISLKKSMAILAYFQTKLLLLTPIVILLAAAGGHFMSRKALRPVADLAAEASRINDRHLDIRLPVPAANDEISRLSRTLNLMLERIDKAFASVRAFTGNASHELRTPISLLRTEIEVALYRPRDSEEYRAILARLHEETVRLTTLVENLLSLARADGGAETIVLAPIRLETLFRRAAETWKSAMADAMLDFRAEIPEGDLVVLGDMQGISRLLSILLENASKFTPPGGSVVLSATSRSADIRISVSDTGIGIAPEHIDRIFDRFFRAATVREHAAAGSGLGLAIGKWIAERHGMELSVETQPGRGSCFSFGLNRIYSNPSANDALTVSPPKPNEELKLASPRLL
jgi:heavy metal sensor kinase